MTSSDYENRYRAYTQPLTQQLAKNCDTLFAPDSSVAQAAAYSLMNGGKRVRGVLTMAVCEMLGGPAAGAVALSGAVEMLHCYSLIHDDLPCMDDADTRRGQPACHKQYGEATALLAGDALLTASFAAIGAAPLTDGQKAAALGLLSRGAGPLGMVYGQELDLFFEHKTPQKEDLMRIHRHKTGDLIETAVLLGAVAADALALNEPALKSYADKLGLVFQIVDDVLDVTATAQQLGKPAGSDADHAKITFATLNGVPAALENSRQLTAQACRELSDAYGEKADFLVQLAQNLLIRSS